MNWLWCICHGFSVNICSKCCLHSETNSITLRAAPWPPCPPRGISNHGGHLLAAHRETPLACTGVIQLLLHSYRKRCVLPRESLAGFTKELGALEVLCIGTVI